MIFSVLVNSECISFCIALFQGWLQRWWKVMHSKKLFVTQKLAIIKKCTWEFNSWCVRVNLQSKSLLKSRMQTALSWITLKWREHNSYLSSFSLKCSISCMTSKMVGEHLYSLYFSPYCCFSQAFIAQTGPGSSKWLENGKRQNSCTMQVCFLGFCMLYIVWSFWYVQCVMPQQWEVIAMLLDFLVLC